MNSYVMPSRLAGSFDSLVVLQVAAIAHLQAISRRWPQRYRHFHYYSLVKDMEHVWQAGNKNGNFCPCIGVARCLWRASPTLVQNNDSTTIAASCWTPKAKKWGMHFRVMPSWLRSRYNVGQRRQQWNEICISILTPVKAAMLTRAQAKWVICIQ